MPPTVVIFRLGSLGDTVVALPCFHAVARRYPDHRRVVLTNAPVAEEAPPLLAVLGDHGLVHGAIAYPAGLRRPGDLFDLARRLRSLNATDLIYLSPPRGPGSLERDWLFFKACGFARILGLPRGSDLARCRIDAGTGEVEREASRLIRTLHPATGAIDLDAPANWDLGLTKLERAVATTILDPLSQRRFVAVHMGGKGPGKDWGEANWTALARSLSAQRSDTALVILGAASDRPRAQTLAAAWEGPALDICGRLTPRESAAVLERACLFIGHDSGPLHLAAIGGAPTLGMFGPRTRPRQWHPVGPRVRILHNLESLDKITVADVAAAAEDMMTR